MEESNVIVPKKLAQERMSRNSKSLNAIGLKYNKFMA